MNIWSSNKDNSIRHLLLLLREEFSETAYQVIDPDMTDACSVRLGNPADPGYSIYIYTYGQQQDNYGVHIEYANTEAAVSDTLEIFDNLAYESVLNLLKLYFA